MREIFCDARRNGHVFGCERNVDDEDAACTGDIANVDVPAVCPDGLAGNREPQAKARPVAAAPLAERLERVAFARGDTTALVFHLNQEVRLFVCACSQHHMSASGREFKGVVQEIVTADASTCGSTVTAHPESPSSMAN